MVEGNAFVAALLKVAAEHRLRAESRRNMMDPYPERTPGTLGDTWRSWLHEMNAGLEKEASEQEGLAEIYQMFADRLIADITGEMIREGLEKLTGKADLVDQAYTIPPLWAADNFLMSPIGRIYLEYYRPFEPPDNGYRIIWP